MTDCCTIDMEVGGVAEFTIEVASTEYAITADSTEFEVVAESSETAIEVAADEFEITASVEGPQGPPGEAGSTPTFNSTNRQGASIVSGHAMAMHSTGVGAILADATDSSKPFVGLNSADASDGDSITVQCGGLFTLDDWTAITGTSELAPRGIYFLGTTPGTLTTTSPSSNPAISQRVGKTVSPTTLDIDPWGFIQL